jgi:hypothetical protein
MRDIGTAIDEAVRTGLAPLLKSAGFRKSGRTFRRTVADVVQIVNVQGSRSNMGTTGRCVVNVGVYLPAVDHLLRTATLDRPDEPDCHIRDRMPGPQHGPNDDPWWALSAADSIDVGRAIGEAWQSAGQSWMASRASMRDCEPFVAGLSKVAVICLVGEGDRAQRALVEYWPTIPSGAYALLVRAKELAGRLGIALPARPEP